MRIVMIVIIIEFKRDFHDCIDAFEGWVSACFREVRASKLSKI